MNASELKNRPIVTLSDAAKVGYIEEMLFDAQYQRVLGFRVKRGDVGTVGILPRSNVGAIGRDAVTIPNPEAITTADRVPEVAAARTLADLQGTRVVSEAGEVQGTVKEVEVDDEAHTVQAYVLSTPLFTRLTHGEPKVSPQQVIQVGTGGIMTVRTHEAGAAPPPEEPGKHPPV